MSQALKDCFDPWKAADRGLVFRPQIDTAGLARLAAVLTKPSGNIQTENYSFVFIPVLRD